MTNEIVKIVLTGLLSGVISFLVYVYNNKKEIEKMKQELISIECKKIYDDVIALIFELESDGLLMYQKEFTSKLEKTSYRLLLYATENVYNEYKKLYDRIQSANKEVRDIDPQSQIDKYEYEIDEDGEEPRPIGGGCSSEEEADYIYNKQGCRKLDRVIKSAEIEKFKLNIINNMRISIGNKKK